MACMGFGGLQVVGAVALWLRLSHFAAESSFGSSFSFMLPVLVVFTCSFMLEFFAFGRAFEVGFVVALFLARMEAFRML